MWNLEFERLVNSYERQGAGSGRTGHRPRRGVFGLFLSVAFVFVIVIIIYFPILFPANNDDVSHSGLGISHRFQSRDDEIYYAEYNFLDYPGTLWRINSNGEEKEKIVENGVDLFALYGDQILYITHSDNYEWILYAVDINGNGKKVLYQSQKENSYIIKMDAVSGRCYALDSDNHLHIVEIDKGKANIINDDITDFCIDGGWIYYIKAKNSEQKLFQLWRSNFNGTRNEQLMDSFESAVDYSDNKIYYINEEDGGIYSVYFSGENEKKIIDSEGRLYLKVIGDWIYYENQGDNPGIYKVKKDGRKNQRILDYEVRNVYYDKMADSLLSNYSVCILDNWFWYYDLGDGDGDGDGDVSYNMIRISDKHNADDVIEDILEEMTPPGVIRKYE